MPGTASLVAMLSTTTGTGNFALTSLDGRRDFDEITEATFFYFITHRDAAEWEFGITGLLSGELDRASATVLGSSNAGSLVDFSAGEKEVVNDIPATYSPAYYASSAAPTDPKDGDIWRDTDDETVYIRVNSVWTQIGGTPFLDSNGNEWLDVGAAASAVNHIQINNAETGEPPEIAAVGDDTNIHLLLLTKGTGSVVSEATIKVEEKAAAEVDDEGYGQFWVRNDAPNTPMFTDDDGNDLVLKGWEYIQTTSGSGADVYDVNISAFNTEYDIIKVFFRMEGAATKLSLAVFFSNVGTSSFDMSKNYSWAFMWQQQPGFGSDSADDDEGIFTGLESENDNPAEGEMTFYHCGSATAETKLHVAGVGERKVSVAAGSHQDPEVVQGIRFNNSEDDTYSYTADWYGLRA